MYRDLGFVGPPSIGPRGRKRLTVHPLWDRRRRPHRASEGPAREDGRLRRAVCPHHDTLPVCTTANIHPPPQHLVTTTMLRAGPPAFSEVAESDLSIMLQTNFGEHPFHALG